MVWCVYYIDIHLTDTTTFLAANTFLMINLNLKKRYLVKQLVNSAQRADPFTKWTVKQDAQDDEKRKDCELKCK